MATIPVVPAFTTGQTPSIAVLNQLAACVSWVNSIPAFCELSGSQTLTTATATALTWTEIEDRDNGHSNSTNPTRYTAQTPGYYDLSADVAFASSSAGERYAYFQVTTGSGNPGGAGNTTQFGDKATTASSTTLTRLSLGMLTPYLYVGDYVEVYAEQTSGGNLATSSCYWELTLVSLGP